MDLYYYIAWLAIISQISFLYQTFRNYFYSLSKYKRVRSGYRPRTVLIVPCKGKDLAFEKNITSFFNQDYENYLLWFVVAETSDPAYSPLCGLKTKLESDSKALDVKILVAGHCQSRSQKIHNLLFAYQHIPDDIEVLAFADSDACIRTDWLSHIVYPLRQPKNGAASGYRWFVPKNNNLPTLALSAINAKVAQLLGNSRFNQAWGGSMAIRVDVFRKIGLDKIWPKALSDDLSLSYAVKKARLKVAFVPACLVPSYESTTWSAFFEFARRQFLITRVTILRTWLFGLFASLYSVLGLWVTIALAFYAVKINIHPIFFTAVPLIFFASQLIRAILRQKMISKLLKHDFDQMKFAAVADIFFFWLWSILLLAFIISSAFGRTITWRGIKYKLISPTETIVINRVQTKS